MLYLDVKFIHILSSTILFGTGIGTALNLFMANRTKDTYLIAKTTRYVVWVDWIFTGTSGFIQPITGLWMVYLNGVPLMTLWVLGSIAGYLVAAFCWFPVVYFQIKMRDFAEVALKNQTPLPAIYHRYYRYWFMLGWPAFLSLIVVFYLMTNKPV